MVRNRSIYADILRVFAICAVVLLHSAAPPMYLFNSIDPSWWWIANIIDAGTRWSVPIFLMLSGMLLLDTQYDEPMSLFFKKRFNKVILPFLVWSVIYSFWTATGHMFFHGEFQYSIQGFLVSFLEGTVYSHLGFCYYLIGLYLITPILRVYVKNATNSNLAYFLILWLIVTTVYGISLRFYDLSIAIPMQLVTGFTGYYILGYFLNRIDVKPIYRRLCYILAGFGLLVTIAGTYMLTVVNDGTLDQYFYGYLTVNVIVVATAVFLYCKYTKWPVKLSIDSSIESRSLVKLSNASWGVFLIHPMIQYVLSYMKLDYTLFNPLIGIPLNAVLTLIISFALVFVMRKIPVIKRIVP